MMGPSQIVHVMHFQVDTVQVMHYLLHQRTVPMPTIGTIDGIKIQVFADHNPPHFHAVIGEFEVLVSISTLEVLEGSMRRKDLEKVLAWAKAHKKEIEDEWQRING